MKKVPIHLADHVYEEIKRVEQIDTKKESEVQFEIYITALGIKRDFDFLDDIYLQLQAQNDFLEKKISTSFLTAVICKILNTSMNRQGIKGIISIPRVVTGLNQQETALFHTCESMFGESLDMLWMEQVGKENGYWEEYLEEFARRHSNLLEYYLSWSNKNKK